MANSRVNVKGIQGVSQGDCTAALFVGLLHRVVRRGELVWLVSKSHELVHSGSGQENSRFNNNVYVFIFYMHASWWCDLGCKIEPHKKQLHLTMAYQFLANHQAVLDAMAKKINPKTQSRWELRLYSRDPRMEKAEVIACFN